MNVVERVLEKRLAMQSTNLCVGIGDEEKQHTRFG